MNDLHYDSRMLLVYLAVKYQGDYDRILSSLVLKEVSATYEEALKVYQALPCKVMTLLDYDYPERLKKVYRPPFVLFYYGDLNLISDYYKNTDGTYTVALKIESAACTLMDLKIIVQDRRKAKWIHNNWADKAPIIYEHIHETLID